MRELLLRRDAAALMIARADLAADDLDHQREAAIATDVNRLLENADIPEAEVAEVTSILREQQRESHAKYERMLDGLWRTALLEGLIADARPGDREFALRYLASPVHTVADAAAALLMRVGGPDDVEALLTRLSYDAAKNAPILAWLVARVADGDGLIELCETHAIETAHKAQLVDSIRAAGLAISDDALDGMLRDENRDLRRAALRSAVVDGSPATARRWLERVLTGGYRYFDTVAYLDRLAYAPPPVAAIARRDLVGEW